MNTTPAMLSQRLRALHARRAGLVAWLWGEAGIGKTHTTRALLRETSCRSLTVAATLPLPDLVRALPRPADPRAWTRAALEGVQAGRAVAAPPAQILAALLGQLAPFVLHVEDLHEADAARLELAEGLAAAVAATRGAGLLVTSRLPPPGTWPERGLSVALERLSPRAAAALLEAEAGATLPPEAAAWVFGRACGNPLFTLEYFRLLARQGHLWNDGRCWRWREPPTEVMPATVEALIERAIRDAAGTEASENAVQARAVLGPGASERLWAEVAGLSSEALAEARRELEGQGVLSGSEFAHPLFREVLMQNLLPLRRQSLSRRALAGLGDDPRAAAPFLPLAGLETHEMLGWLRQAAQAARDVGDTLQAARFQARAVEYATGEERGRLALDAADELYDHDLGEAIRLLEVAREVYPGDFTVLAALASYLAQAGHRDRVLGLLGDLSPEERAGPRGFMLDLKVAHYLQDSAQVVERWRAHPELQARVSPGTIRDVAFAQAEVGDTTGALDLAARALGQPGLSLEDRVILLETCGFACYAGSDFAPAERYYTEAIGLFRDGGQAHRAGSLLFNRSVTRQALADFAGAIRDAEEARDLAAGGGHARFHANAQLALGGAWLELGEYGRAEELLLEAHAAYRQSGLTGWQVDAELKLSELYRQWGSPHASVLARKHADSALALARSLNNPRYVACVLPCAVMAEALFGKPGRALALAEEGYALVSAGQEMGALYPLLWARAAARPLPEQAGEALADLRLALDLAEGARASLDAHKIGLELARLTNDLALARDHAAWFGARGLLVGVRLTRRYFPELDQTAPSSLPPASRPAPSLRLEVLGELRLGEEGQMRPVRGRQRRALLACLLEARLRGHGEASRLELVEALYPQTGEPQAVAALKELVHQTRVALGAGVIQTTGGGYALGDLDCDAETFLRTGETTLWRGPYLAGEEPVPGGLVADTLYEALTARAQALGAEQAAEAARLGRLLCEANPYDLPALALTLRALRAVGNHRSLARFYASARRGLLEVGEALPEDWATFLDGQVQA